MSARTSPARPGDELLLRDIRQQSTLLAAGLDGARAEVLAQAAGALAGPSHIRFVGIGSSRHVAGYGAACADLLTQVPASVLAAPGAGVPLPRFNRDELIVLVSQSGATPALLDVARAAHTRGAQVWALTNGTGSALEQLADLVLAVEAGPESVVPATKSVTMMMLLLRAICGPVDTDALARLSALVRSLVEDSERRMSQIAATSPPPDAVVAGGFAGQWVADEVAIKLAEISAHLAVSESLVDYLHGPAAVAAPALAFLAPSDPNAAAVAGRPDCVLVGPSEDYALTLPSCGDPTLDAIAQVVAGQCLALHWARAAGLDPDDPRGLRKVTFTH